MKQASGAEARPRNESLAHAGAQAEQQRDGRLMPCTSIWFTFLVRQATGVEPGGVAPIRPGVEAIRTPTPTAMTRRSSGLGRRSRGVRTWRGDRAGA